MKVLTRGGVRLACLFFFQRKEEWNGSFCRNEGEAKLPEFYA